jgi:hypothetical protein
MMFAVGSSKTFVPDDKSTRCRTQKNPNLGVSIMFIATPDLCFSYVPFAGVVKLN